MDETPLEDTAHLASGDSLASLRIEVHPGHGLVARYPSVLLVVLGTVAAQRPVTDRLLEICSGAPSPDSSPRRRVTRQIAGLLSEADPEEVPSFCAVSDAGAGKLAAILHGDVELHVVGPHEERLSGADVSTWVDRILAAGFHRLVVTGARSAEHDPDDRLDLRAGVVPGGGAAMIPPKAGTPVPATPAAAELSMPSVVEPPATVLEPQPPAVETPVQPEPAGTSEAVEGTDFQSIPLVDPEPEVEGKREPLPMAGEKTSAPVAETPSHDVQGIVCARGHFNDPAVAYCSVCGISMVQRTHNFVLGPRPPLGVLVLDDGATFAVSSNYVLGREPGEDDEVRSGRAQPLMITDEAATVSRVHADIQLKEWEVVIRDRGSANGTYLAPPGTSGWTPLPPNVPVTLVPGTRVQVGQRVFVFDSHHKV